MKYVTQVEIAASRERVSELVADPAHYSAWQESLQNMELLEGQSGQVGARTRLDHQMGKREITMIETVTHRGLPGRFEATYEAKGVWNHAVSRFEAIDDDRTRWTMESEFRCSGLMWFMTTLMPGMFKKQTLATMSAFKAFAETSES